jgi:fructose-bisphosphate aldolase class I
MTLEEIAKKMCAKGKGILAADESTGTMDKRLKSVNVECSEKNRLTFRQTLFSSDAMKNYIGGVILFDETIRQKTSLGMTVPELILKNNSLPGIKVDKGAKPLSGSTEETITEGLDGLRERLKDYYELGARFTKWRAVYNIGGKYPSSQSIKSNAHSLARYAALVQEAKMVPIVEPEVLMEGDHDIDKCYQVTTDVLNECYNELANHKVDLKGTVLKPNMIIPGSKCSQKVSSEEIAKKTLDCLKKNVPSEVPGIAFLSGGQSEVDASKNLNEINKINNTNFLITFSYGRGLQASALKAFGDDQNNIKKIQSVFAHRAKMNGLSSKGEWSEDFEKEAVAQSI